MSVVELSEAKERLRLVRDSAASVLPRDKASQRVRGLRFKEPGFDPALWQQMCELGWAGLRVPEERGGSGLDNASTCAIAEALGAAMSPEPFIGVATAARLLDGPLLASVLKGERIVVPAWLEEVHDLDGAGRSRFDAGRVSGRKRMVGHAAAADAFVVGTQEGPVLVARDAPGVRIESIGLHDGGFAAELGFDRAPGQALAGANAGSFGQALEEAALASAAYLLGCSEAAFDITLAYIGVRRQFGRPIGGFQSLQHRAVDMKIQIELTRAVIDGAVAALDEDRGTPESRRALVSRAKMRAADTALLVGRESVQFHGAMGMTDECDIGLYARKILTIQSDWGSALAHRRRFAAIEEARHD